MADPIIAGRRRFGPQIFWGGVLAVALGVCAHLPAFAMVSRHMGPVMSGAPTTMSMNAGMSGMAMGPLMTIGMLLIIGGTLAAGYGLLPGPATRNAAMRPAPRLAPALDGRMTRAHWELTGVLTIAVIIDVMKPATLGFVMPGMAKDYALSRSELAVLPFVALTGTAVGSYIWGVLADRFGRRAAILLAAIMFVGTAICGAMPSYAWNVFMCFMMGLPAGGMLPIAYTLLSEVAPARHRGWLLVMLGGAALAGGYLAASTAAALFEPQYGWRILWLLGMPTGLALVLLNSRIPETPGFLLSQGRTDEFDRVVARYGLVPSRGTVSSPQPVDAGRNGAEPRVFGKPMLGMSVALNLTAVVWGLVNFGLLLWLPTDLQARGLDA
ncbi:MAG: MFS transporter, partial [Novosphingobium sp.]